MIFYKKYDIIYIESERKEMINMTREDAAKVAKALDNIEQFECFFDEIETTIQHSEFYGSIVDFCESVIIPAMQVELARRKKVLEEM